MGSRWDALIVDALDPERLGRWWAEVLDHRVERVSPQEVVVGSGLEGQPRLIFLRHADAKHAKNRLHLDLRPDDLDAELERLVNMGARHVDVGQPDDAAWVVLADPEGNEFCILRTRE
ncbi:VOC family protein [Dactylosporangium aurantiacum]|uniref:VOC family protein n=1 Tax=Dactylosporangium aurantiacum TaxID=35754 RepID=A0A9Q9IGD4_9ACTN|nr:VOC family protein [Dactylosporangium aurantiacum]MDG6102152.1 VOC family protein [Dactylosporangium aurantiacum]UWZ53527.1 VOC family protein [Dactylosporangium aurantiacum]